MFLARRIALVHGGVLGEADASTFWARPGVIGNLTAAGYEVIAPDRLTRATDWYEESAHLATLIPPRSVVVAGSNGCSAALRLVLDHPTIADALVLCWPATNIADPRIPPGMGAGGIVRGVTDDELPTITVPTGLIPCEPENTLHRRATVDDLAALIPGATIGAGCSESPHPRFDARSFTTTLGAMLEEMNVPELHE